MKKLLFLPLFVCLALIGFLPVSVEAGFPYSMTYTVSAGDTILADHYNTGNNEHINNNIPESIDDYSATVAEMEAITDPYPASTESQAITLDGELQRLRYQLDSLIKKFNTTATKWEHDVTDEGVLWVTGADVASATALPLINDGLRVDVTGTTTVTSMNTVGIGTVKCLQFDDALILTHHATDLILPSGENITTVAGDRAWFHEYASGDWELVGWDGHKIEHTHLTPAQGGTVAGVWELIQSITASADASIDFDAKFTANYDLYMVVFKNIKPATDATNLLSRLSTDGGSTWLQGASEYGFAVHVVTAAPAEGSSGDNTSAFLQLNSGTFGTAANEEADGIVYIYDPFDASRNTKISSRLSKVTSATVINSDTGAGVHYSGVADDSIQFFFSSGNVASGTFELYGLRK